MTLTLNFTSIIRPLHMGLGGHHIPVMWLQQLLTQIKNFGKNVLYTMKSFSKLKTVTLNDLWLLHWNHQTIWHLPDLLCFCQLCSSPCTFKKKKDIIDSAHIHMQWKMVQKANLEAKINLLLLLHLTLISISVGKWKLRTVNPYKEAKANNTNLLSFCDLHSPNTS